MTAFEEGSRQTLPDMGPGSMQMTSGMVDTAGVRRRVLTILYRSRTLRAGKHGCIGASTPGHSMPTRADAIRTSARLDASLQLLRPARIRRPLLLISHHFSDTISRDALPSVFYISKESFGGQIRTQEEQGTDLRPVGTDCGHRRHLPLCCHVARSNHQPQAIPTCRGSQYNLTSPRSPLRKRQRSCLVLARKDRSEAKAMRAREIGETTGD